MGKRRLRETPIVCENCGATKCVERFRAKRQRFCSQKCARNGVFVDRSRENNPHWKGGLTQSVRGYWYVRMPDHPRAANGYVKRANLVVEGILGRYLLPGEEVHHKNRDKEDDSPGNLELLTKDDHSRLHADERRKPRPPRPPPRIINWPDNDVLLGMSETMTQRQIAAILGCSQPAVLYRIRKITRAA